MVGHWANCAHFGLPPTIAFAVGPALSSCSSKPSIWGSGASTAPRCPTAPISVAVSVSRWGDIISTLGGDRTKVTTVPASSSVDPHDHEPSPADAKSFFHAGLVVVNGVGYDAWASKLAAATAPNASVVSARRRMPVQLLVDRGQSGANPPRPLACGQNPTTKS